MLEKARLITAIANNLPGMVGYWSRDLHCLFANASYQTWFGLSEEQMRGITMQQLMGPELFARNEPYVLAVLKGEDQQFERTLVKANGETGHTWAQYIAERVDGEVHGFFVLVSDITALKNSQLQLEKAIAALRIAAIAFEGQEGILVTDDRRCVLRSNAAFTRITGHESADMLGQRPLQMRCSRHTDAFYDAIFADVLSKGTWSGELWCKHAKGHDFPISLTATAVRNELGVIANYVFSYIDISERPQREEQRRKDEAAQRAALVREVHHRIKNNLQGISGLLRRFGQEHPETASVLDLAIGQLKSIAAVHGLHGRSGENNVSLHDMLRAIAGHIEEIWQSPITVEEMQSEGDSFIAEEEGVPLAMILNELLLNAVKHSDPNCPGASVQLQQDPQGFVAKVLISNKVAHGQTVPKDLLSGSGQLLMRHLMPSNGARMSASLRGANMDVELILSSPVLVLK